MVAFLSLLMAGMADRTGKPARELHSEFEAAIALGLFLGSRQPDLAHAFADEWDRNRPVSSAKYLEDVLRAYLDFAGKKALRKATRRPPHP